MSAFGNFFVISKENFEEYCKMAHLVAYRPVPPGTSCTHEVHMVGPEKANSPEFKKIEEHHAKLWDFLHKNGKEPYEFKWSSYELDGLLGWLKDVKHINLMEIKFVAPDDDEFFWLVFDETIKKKYLDQLRPTNFKQEDLVYSFEHFCEQQRDASLKEMASRLSKDEMQSYLAKMQEYEAMDARNVRSKKDERTKLGQAMMDGITTLYKYIQLIDAQSVVILNIG